MPRSLSLITRVSALIGLAAVVCMVLGGPLLPSVQAQSEFPLSGDYFFEVGHVIAVPGQGNVLVPITVTNSQPLVQWQLAVDYEEQFVAFIDLQTDGTASEELSPTVMVDDSGSTLDITVSYGTPLEAGTSQLVAYLVFELILAPPGPDPHESGLPLFGEAPVVFTVVGGQVVIPAAVGGGITIYSGDLLIVGAVEGDNFDTILVPINLWSGSPTTVFAMGLEAEDAYMIEGIDLAGGDFEGGTVTIDVSLGHWLITIIPPQPVPPGPDQQVAVIEFRVNMNPPDPEEYPLPTGSYALTPIPGETTSSGNPIPNLLAGSIEMLPHFVRGDVDFDHKYALPDVVLIALHLYSSQSIPCQDAADTNDDGSLGLEDLFFLASFMYEQGPPSPPPVPSQPGPDPTPDDLGCL